MNLKLEAKKFEAWEQYTVKAFGDNLVEPKYPLIAMHKAFDAGYEAKAAEAADLLAALEAAAERMEAVADGILIEKRHKGVSPETHVRHMAAHLGQHAKKARAAIAKAKGQ